LELSGKVAIDPSNRYPHRCPSEGLAMVRRHWISPIAMAVLIGVAAAADPPAHPKALPSAHAHNDYEHPRPLFDALNHGFCSVEADIFLVDGQLLVGHNRGDLKPERTLESLYLDPLRARAKANSGKVFPDAARFWLLIDVKTDAKPTYAALHEVLSRYADLLTAVSDGNVEPRAVTVVVSGNSDRDGIAAQTKRFAGIDGRPRDLDSDVPAHLIPWISERWGSLFQWSGEGAMPEPERTKLREFTAKAHRHGRLVRFWGTPEKLALWQEMRAAGVDLINTDKLAELQRFFQSAAAKE
jgi:hypothetical protein